MNHIEFYGKYKSTKWMPEGLKHDGFKWYRRIRMVDGRKEWFPHNDEAEALINEHIRKMLEEYQIQLITLYDYPDGIKYIFQEYNYWFNPTDLEELIEKADIKETLFDTYEAALFAAVEWVGRTA